MKVANINFDNIKTIEDCAKIFKAIGLVLQVDYAKENGMEHLLGEELEMPEQQQPQQEEFTFE
jgi:hypothetical protein